MKRKTLSLLIIGVLILAVVIMDGCIEEENSESTSEPKPGQLGEPKIVIKEYNISIYDVGVDRFYFDSVKVLLRNEGRASAEIEKLLLSSGKSKIDNTLYSEQSLNPGEEKDFKFYLPTYTAVEKEIGADKVKGTISIINTSGGILAEKNITIQVPNVRIGDTITEVEDTNNLSMTLLWWKKSDIAVDGLYVNGYYTFIAKPNMTFIILAYKFQNNWNREQITPYINQGEIATNKKYIYNRWNPPEGVNSEEYQPRESTEEEVNELIGDSGGYENLLPGESVEGCIVFEIPEDQTPIETSIAYMLPLIKYWEETK